MKGNEIRAGQIIYVKTKGKKNRAVPITKNYRLNCPPAGKRRYYLNHAIQPLERPCNVLVSRHMLGSKRTFTPYIRLTFYDEWGEHFGASADIETYRY